MLDIIPGLTAKHEPPPRFSEVPRDSESIRRFWVEEKLPAIEREEGQVYVETSHAFKYVAFGLGAAFDLISIRRNNRDVALSLWRRISVPARSDRGREFLYNPDEPCLCPLPNWERFTDYQLCYWYTLETEARIEQIKRLPQKNVVLDFNELVKGNGFRRLVCELELPEPNWEAYHKRRHWRVNVNPQNYYRLNPNGNLGGLESEVRGAISGG